jgi:transcriptional regulator with PAS, ATPase and Fis domain
MIYGESGTGKELVAQNIHYMSNRRNKPFVAINCASLSDELLESELFGHVKGAFTNALKDKPGLFLIANNGSLFLDEVSEMSPRLQAKLLRVLQEKHFQPVGSVDIINIDVRILGASNQNLKMLIEENKFREDLYYRLNVVEINLPKLEDRKEDIPLLINHFIEKEFERTKKRIILSPEVMEILINHNWRGNIRELENFIKMLAVISEHKLIQITDLPESFFVNMIANSMKRKELWEKYDFQCALNSAVENFEKEFLRYHIEKNNGNISKTAEAIGLSRVSLYKKINQYNLLHEESVNT